MRDENKRAYYVAKRVTETDEYGTVFASTYAAAVAYSDVISDRRGESEDIEKFGERPVDRAYIVHDENDDETARDIALNDGVWLDGAPTEANANKPPYIVENVQAFGRKHVYTIRKAVDANAVGNS